MKPTLKELKEQINALQKQIENYESEPEFEVGKWYKVPTFAEYPCDAIINYSNKDYDLFGFDHNGNWCTTYNNFKNINTKGIIPATKEEIESALIAEAKKRGFEEGVRIESITLKGCKGILKGTLKYCKEHDRLSYSSLPGNIYKQGQWAEIIKEDKIEIGGYEVRFDSYSHATTIDGNPFSKYFWQSAKVISENSKAKIMVGCSKQFDVSLETINKILNKLKNKT